MKKKVFRLKRKAVMFNVTDEDMKPVKAFEEVKEKLKSKKTKKAEK